MKKNIDILEIGAFIDPYHKDIFDALYKGENIQIFGKAGSGKSHLIKFIKTNLNPYANVVFLAPTGLSAINIDGITIHKLFQLDTDSLALARSVIKYNKQHKKMLEKIDYIIIDEISMVRSDVFNKINSILKKICKNDLPFGGKRVILIGDLLQLPPVVSKKDKILFKKGEEFYFNSYSYKELNVKTFYLEKNFRQIDDVFTFNLDKLRLGINDGKVIKYFNKRNFEKTPKLQEDADKLNPIYLVTTNATANGINKMFLEENKNPSKTYFSKKTGVFEENEYPFPKEMELKKDLKVMICANSAEGHYVNGSVGFIHDLKDDHILIKLTSNKKIVKLETKKFENRIYELDEKTNSIKDKILGEYHQLPLKLAYAITIHKSQGQTLDSAILGVSDGIFCPFQAYVGLSRVRKIENLFLDSDIKASDIFVDRTVLDFYEKLQGLKEK